jgi:hypothetical protein
MPDGRVQQMPDSRVQQRLPAHYRLGRGGSYPMKRIPMVHQRRGTFTGARARGYFRFVVEFQPGTIPFVAEDSRDSKHSLRDIATSALHWTTKAGEAATSLSIAVNISAAVGKTWTLL